MDCVARDLRWMVRLILAVFVEVAYQSQEIHKFRDSSCDFVDRFCSFWTQAIHKITRTKHNEKRITI